MMNVRAQLEADITEGIAAAISAGELDQTMVEGIPVIVERPKKSRGADYASPVALALGKKAGKAPMEILEVIAKHMPKKEYIGALEAAAPGFLNISLSPTWLASRVDDIAHGDVAESLTYGEGKIVNLEFISANPTGPLTLGNARTAFSADTLGNVFEVARFSVIREYYINDAGAQIRRLGESVLRRILQSQGEEVDFPEDLYQGDYIHHIAENLAEMWKENEAKVFSKQDLEDTELIERISVEAMEKCLTMIKDTVHNKLQIHFDVWKSERVLRKSGVVERTLQVLRDKGFTYSKDGAEYLKTTQFGDAEDRVLVKKDGEYAYIAPDIAYHQDKFDRKFDLMFTYLGADHIGHVPKVKAAMQALGNDVSKLQFMVAQIMSFNRAGEAVKLSKRKGEVYGPDDLINEIGYDAARFFLVQHNLSSHMELDLEMAKERSERNPVYYVQYAYVRLQSILRKAKEQGLIEAVGESVPHSLPVQLSSEAEIRLVKTMHQLPEMIEHISRTYEIHQLTYYAHDLARAIHHFYRDVPVLSDNKDESLPRLQLVLASRAVLGKTLDLLGISKPDVM